MIILMELMHENVIQESWSSSIVSAPFHTLRFTDSEGIKTYTYIIDLVTLFPIHWFQALS